MQNLKRSGILSVIVTVMFASLFFAGCGSSSDSGTGTTDDDGTYSISGTVYEADGTTEITDSSTITVTAYTYSATTNSYTAVDSATSTLTTGSGAYKISGLSAGKYYLQCDDSSDTYAFSTTTYKSVKITDADVTKDLSAIYLYTLTGTVYAVDGTTPISTASIKIQAYTSSIADQLLVSETTSEEDGTYTLTGLYEWNYRIKVYDENGTYIFASDADDDYYAVVAVPTYSTWDFTAQSTSTK